MIIDEIKYIIRKKYPYLEEEDIDIMIECAKNVLLDTLYPFDKDIDIVPPRKVTWVYRCVLEQIEKKGITSVIAYKENGISITFDKSHISQSLLNEILPVIGTD